MRRFGAGGLGSRSGWRAQGLELEVWAWRLQDRLGFRAFQAHELCISVGSPSAQQLLDLRSL